MNNQSAIEILGKYKKFVWPEIKKYLSSPVYPKSLGIPGKYLTESKFHWQLVTNYPERKGKYFRPTLLLLTCEAMGEKASSALKTAAAMQISEDWLLIHDDFEDGSLERRGKPTLHRIYGNELAINAGDALHAIMWKVLIDNETVLSKERTSSLLNEFCKILTRTILGQTIEIRWAKDNKIDFTDSDWFFICDGKTSYYTIAGPMRLGAIIAGADNKQLESLAEFGVYLGRCFQIIDDILDLTSDFKGLKKQTGNDIYEGKRTIMLGHLLRNANIDNKKRISAILSKSRNEKTPKEVAWVIDRMQHYGSIKYSKELAAKLKKKAYKIFQKELTFLSIEPARSRLQTLIDFVLERKY